MAQQRHVYLNRDGVRKTLIWDDDAPDHFVIRTEEDIEPLLESVHRDREIMRNNGPNKVLGRVPRTVVERAAHEQWGEDDWRKWWNGEGRAFRIWNPGGRI
jgi:hypothetical protein